MICASCGHGNVDGARFCARCGTAQSTTCPQCSAANSPDNAFCIDCGAALTAAVPTVPTRAERRVVTVLFADIVGFTPLSEFRDPEDVHELVTRYFERSRDILERFGGTVDKFIGDAVMAWWGAVEAREDDAERAVRAGLALVDMAGSLGEETGTPDLALRAGVLTGETSVGPGGNDKGLIIGDLVNTASRLQSIADPGTVVVGESTRRLAAGAIEFEALGEKSVKGKQLPVAAFRAVRVAPGRGGRGRTEGVDPPFTGRRDELRLLQDQLHATGRESGARLVSVVGEAGIGKTRLAQELAAYAEGIAEPIYWHRGRSPAYGDGVALWSLGEMVRDRAGIAETDDRATSRSRLRQAVLEFVSTEDDRRWIEPRLAALLGLEEMPPGDRDELFAAIRAFFQWIAARGTTVMVFEDLHWSDDGMLDFVTSLIERSPRHPILAITLARPELLDRRRGWGSGRRHTVAMHLAPLPDGDVAEMVTAMAPELADETVGAVVARAGGIPLYAVEFVRMLVRNAGTAASDTKGDPGELAIPDSLAAVIGARIDRLPLPTRDLLQDAAVLGQSFTLDALAAIRQTTSDDLRGQLAPLIDGEVLYIDDDPRSPERGQYRFVQGLIREVAYGRLSRADRHSRHLAVAEWLATREEPELAGIVASHYLSARENAPSGLVEVADQGRASLLEAADRAGELRDYSQAVRLRRRALELTEEDGERARILIEATAEAELAGELSVAEDLGNQAIEVAAQVGDETLRLRATIALGRALSSSIRSSESLALLLPSFASLDTLDSPEAVRLGLEVARAHMLFHEPDRAREVVDLVLPDTERLVGVADVIDGIITRGTALQQLGRAAEAEANLVGAIRLADRHDLQNQAIRGLNNLAVLQWTIDPDAAARTWNELFERAERLGGGAWLQRARFQRVNELISEGRFEEALETLDSIDADHLAPFQALGLGVNRLIAEGMMGVRHRAGKEVRKILDSWGDTSDRQSASLIELRRAQAHAIDGEWRETVDTGVDSPWWYALEVALTAAIRLRDPRAVRRVLASAESTIPRTGRLGIAINRISEGALAVMEGHDGGTDLMASGLDLMADVERPFNVADWRAAVASLLGLDHPVGLAAGTAAAEWVAAVGARGLAAVWADGLPEELAIPADSA